MAQADDEDDPHNHVLIHLLNEVLSISRALRRRLARLEIGVLLMGGGTDEERAALRRAVSEHDAARHAKESDPSLS